MGQEQVRIFDTTLRDGEQSPGFSLRVSEKLLLARQLDALGVDIIEAGSPISSPADAEAVRRISAEIRRPVIACLARCHRADLEKAAWAIKPAAQGRIHTFIATSDLHLNAKLRMTREQCLEAAVESVRYARHHTFDVEFSAEDATRSDLDFLCRVVEAVVKPGATSDMLTQLTGQAVQVNKAIVGRNAFAHEAGIHQDGILKDRRTYEIIRAEDVGAPWNPLVLGKHSGRHAVQKRCKDLGLDVEGTELVDVYRALMAIADDR